MIKENYIPLLTLCTHYKVEMDFIYDLSENDLLEIIYIEESPCIHQDVVARLEKMLRLHQDLEINLAGIDAVFNLLNQVDVLQGEVRSLKNRLKTFED
ncbi:MAG TPA: chaperone modulator CbpM [Pelobium sp.]|nr:chaperone modulator CbpM [Pelobium sp.]